MKLGIWTLIGCVLIVAGCDRLRSRGGAPNPLEAAPVDTARVKSAEVPSWGYRREISADLDGDRKLERIVIAADVRVGPSGPLWEDGHRWAVYVEPEKGVRTMLYGAFVPNGFAEAAVTAPDDDGHRRVLIQERTPQQVRALEVEYQDPGKARLSSAAHYQIGDWLPGSATMP
jgi:hypothetical protein